MIGRIAIVLAFVCSMFQVPAARSRPVDAQIGIVTAQVKKLGQPGNNDLATVRQLALYPAISMRIIVSSLGSVSDTQDIAEKDGPNLEHTLWLIRALRFISGGQDFCSATNHKFGMSEYEQNRRYWLRLAHGDCLTFFAIWPSRDETFIAPRDAQLRIIEMWRRWLLTLPAKLNVIPLHNPSPAKWLW